MASVVSIALAATLAAGCTTTITGQTSSYTVRPTVVTSKPILQAPVCAAGAHGVRTAFFVTISGGGSRAAFLGARVLSELRDVDGSDLTSQINAISAVSGGSIAASLYGLSRDAAATDSWRPVWNDELIRERLAANLKLKMAQQLANPIFLGGYVFGQKTRTGALTAALDSRVLVAPAGKGPFTLADLNPARPQIIINSTVATKDNSAAFRPRPFGSLFTFTAADMDSIGVDYASVPLARAVAASAAFPGLLSPVVLNRFQLGST